MIERLGEGRLREASTKRKRERITPYRGEKGKAKEIKKTKKRERGRERETRAIPSVRGSSQGRGKERR